MYIMIIGLSRILDVWQPDMCAAKPDLALALALES